MAIHNLPGLGLEGNYPVGYTGWGPGVDISLRILSVVCQLKVLDRVAVEPGSPTQGDIYLLTATANDKKIAAYDDGGWVYLTPNEGWLCYVADEDVYYVYSGAAWAPLFNGITVTASQISDASANGRSLITAANYAAMKALAHWAGDGANSDITSLSGLTTPLTVPQGGTGVATLTGLAKGNGASAFSAAIANTDYTNPAGLSAYAQPLASILSALTALATAGIIARTGAGTVAARTLTGPAAGITVSNGDGVSGNPTLALANDLAALEGLPGTGLASRIAADTWAQRSLVAPAAGFTIADSGGVAGNPTFALADDLAALEAMAGTGLVTRTAANTYAQRTATGTANQIAITNGDGVAGNPTIGLAASLSFSGITITNLAASSVTNTPAGTISATDVQAALNELDTEKAALAGANFTGNLAILDADFFMQSSGVTSYLLDNSTTGIVTFQVTRWGGGPSIQYRAMGGTPGAPSTIATGSILARVRAQFGAVNTDNWDSLDLRLMLTDPSPATGARGGQYRFLGCPAGSATLGSWMFLDENGLQIAGANVVVDLNRIIRPRSYTVATLPTITTTGIIHVSDDGGGATTAFSDGTNWRRNKDRKIVATTNTTTMESEGAYAGATQYITPLTGASQNISNDVSALIIEPAGVIATLTLTMPTAPRDGQSLAIMAAQTITAITHNAAAGQTLKGAITTLAANTSASWRYKLSNTTWYRN